MANTARSGSSGTAIAVGRQLARGTPVRRDGRPIESVAAAPMVVDNGVLTGEFDIPFHPGYGTLTFTLVAVVSGSSIVVEGYDINGNAITDTLDTDANVVNTTTNSYVSDPAPTATPNGFTTETIDVVANTEAIYVPGMVNKSFPVSNLNLNEQADTTESDLITARGGFTEDEIAQFYGGVDYTTGILLEDIAHLLRGQFNPTQLVSTAVATQDVASVAIPAAGALTAFLPMQGTPAEPYLDHPSKAKITFATAPGAGTMTIEGFIKIGSKSGNRRFRSETITLGAGTEYETANFYAAEDLVISVVGVTTTGNAAFSWDPELYETDLELSLNDPEFPGWTVQGLVGGIPVVAKDFVPSEMTIEATPTGITLQMVGPASEVTYRRTIKGGDREVLVLDKTYTPAATRRYAGYSGSFRFAGESVKATGVTIGFNRNYEPDDAFDGDRFKTDITAGDKRITIAPTTRLRSGDAPSDVFTRWQEVFRDNIRTALAFYMFNYERTGQRQLFVIEFPSCQLNESPQKTVAGTGPIDQPLSFLALLNTANESPMKMTIYTHSAYTE